MKKPKDRIHIRLSKKEKEQRKNEGKKERKRPAGAVTLSLCRCLPYAHLSLHQNHTQLREHNLSSTVTQCVFQSQETDQFENELVSDFRDHMVQAFRENRGSEWGARKFPGQAAGGRGSPAEQASPASSLFFSLGPEAFHPSHSEGATSLCQGL